MKILVCVLNLARRRDRREWMEATLQLDEDEGITVKYINACDGLAGAGLAPMERKQEGAVISVVGLMASTSADQQPPDGAVRSDGFIRDEAGGLSHHGYTFRPRPGFASCFFLLPLCHTPRLTVYVYLLKIGRWMKLSSTI